MKYQNYKLIINKLFFLSILVVIFFISSGYSEVIERKYTFDEPDIVKVSINSTTYDRINVNGLTNSGQTGFPDLPVKGVRLLIPYGHEIDHLEIIAGENKYLGDGYLIEPVRPVFPLSIDPESIPVTKTNEAVYAMSTPYPKESFKNNGIQVFRGYNILMVNLYPVKYIPKTGELIFTPELTVRVTTSPVGKGNEMFRGQVKDAQEVLGEIDNPSILSSYEEAPVSKSVNYDLLIITTPDLADAFTPLKDYHDTTGHLDRDTYHF